MVSAFAARFSLVEYGERKKIKDFCLNYRSSFVLDYYTQDTFFYRVINHVLRHQRYDIIYQYRHAIIDLIERLRQFSPSEDDSLSLVLYRGQFMTIFELEKMKNNVGELVSSTSFLSTTMNGELAQIFAGDGSYPDPCLASVIFKIHLDVGQPMRPYALINNSAEDEVLFSPGTKFVLMSCRKLHDSGRLWLMDLKAISEKQQEQLTLNHGETFLLLSSASGWPTLGRGCSSSNHLMRPLSKVETDLGHPHEQSFKHVYTIFSVS
jgi:hypothetical protein